MIRPNLTIIKIVEFLQLKSYFDQIVKIYFNFGPYIGFALSGKIESSFGGTTEEEDIDWGSDPDNDMLKRFDFGGLAGAGVEIKSIQFMISYGIII